MSIIDKARDHYKKLNDIEPKKIEVPEWDTTVYVKQKVSLEKVGEIIQLSNEGKIAEAMAVTLIHRLVDEKGDPLFRRPDKVHLMKAVDPDVIARIAQQINEGDPDFEDVEGN